MTEPRHDKTNNVAVRPANSDQPGHTLILLVLSCRGSCKEKKWIYCKNPKNLEN